MSSVHIFVTVDDIKAIAPGADQSLIEDTVRPYLLPAHKIVAAIIGVPLFNDISEERETDTRKYLVTAIVNRVMYDYKLFETVQKRQTGSGDTFKYELQAMQEAYLGYYFDAIDSLIAELNASLDTYKEWKQTRAAKTLDSLLLKTTEEFNACYGIDSSDYFFFSSIFLQEKVIDKYIAGMDLTTLPEVMLRRIKGVVATLTVAYALRQFDFTMLPRSLRNASADGAYRHASSVQYVRY